MASRNPYPFLSTRNEYSRTSSTTDYDRASLELSYLSSNEEIYREWIDDLSIIDGVYYDSAEQENFDDGTNVASTAHDLTQKHTVLQHLLRSEACYTKELTSFVEILDECVHPWFTDEPQQTSQRDRLSLISAKKQDLDNLHNIWRDISLVHGAFSNDLRQRLQIWGPTQLVSDIFIRLLHNISGPYEELWSRYSLGIVAFDSLYREPLFIKHIDKKRQFNTFSGGASTTAAAMAASNRYRRPSTPNCSTFHSTTALASIPSILEYLTMPLNRIFTYTSTLTTLARYTSLTHPDHNGLTQALHQFEKLKKSWTEKIKDCSDHLAILEAYHTIALCPATVTPHRRLILRAPLVKVNLDDPSDISDQRIYYLCNDMLFFCRKKPKTLTLQCKGSLSLMQALVRPILPQLAAEMLQGTPWIRKPVFPSLTRRKKNAPSPTPPEHDKVVYGIEVLVPENNADYMAAFHQNYAGSGPVVRRRHVLRMQAREDQDTWLHHLQVVIQAVNKPPANIIS